MEQEKINNPIIKQGAIGVLAIGLIASVGFYLSQDKSIPAVVPVNTKDVALTAEQQATAKRAAEVAAAAMAAARSGYKDGVYKANGTYSSPAGKEEIAITLTFANNTITAGTFTGKATHPASKKWQAEFSKGFNQAVVGKKISDLSLTVVNGSSLTSQGFMNAFETIKTQAKI